MAVTQFRFQTELKEREDELRGKSPEERRRLVFRWVKSGAIDVQLFGALLDGDMLMGRDEHQAA